jgi:anti-sigma regulatory factor (Ser/Thr protein kinase)
MAEEHSRVQLTLPADEQSLHAVVAAAEHFADRSGMELGPRTALVAACQEACRSTFPLLTREDATIGVIIEDFDDRIEVMIEHEGEALPSAGLDTFAFPEAAQQSPGMSGLMLMSLVDRVQYQTEGGVQRMTLVKYTNKTAANKP